MPEQETIDRAKQDKEEGKSPSTQAGEFVREEIHHVREGKHGVRSTKQAIAIGLSKARRAGVDLEPPAEGQTSQETRQHAKRDRQAGQRGSHKPSAKRSRATSKALKRERRVAVGVVEAGEASRAETVAEVAVNSGQACRQDAAVTIKDSSLYKRPPGKP